MASHFYSLALSVLYIRVAIFANVVTDALPEKASTFIIEPHPVLILYLLLIDRSCLKHSSA